MIGLTMIVIYLSAILTIELWERRRKRREANKPSRVIELSYSEASFPCGCKFNRGVLRPCEAHRAMIEVI